MDPVVLELSQQGGPSTTIMLSPSQGAELKELLERNIDCRLTSYCHQIGMEYSNIANQLGGRKKVSLRTLERLFSKSHLVVECRIEFLILKRDIEDAQDADCQSLDDILFLEEQENAQEEQ